MFGLPTITTILVGGTVLLAVLVLLIWALTFREAA